MHESGHGTKRANRNVCHLSAFGAKLCTRRSGDSVERGIRQSSGLERGVHLPDAVPLRQVTRQRKQQKRCRLALREERPEGPVVPARPNASLSSIAKPPRRSAPRCRTADACEEMRGVRPPSHNLAVTLKRKVRGWPGEMLSLASAEAQQPVLKMFSILRCAFQVAAICA